MQKGYYGFAVSHRLLMIGWSERELARRIGASQAQVSRITHSTGRQCLSVSESEALDKIAAFIVENPMPRRSSPAFLIEGEEAP